MEYKKALHKAAALCSQQERCISEISKKLENWHLEETACQDIIRHLKKEQFIDEQRFANYYVKDKFRFNAWGRIKISYHLKQKGIPPALIENAMEELNPDEYLLKLAELLRGKLKQIKNKDPWQTKAALLRFAQSRGFEPALVFQCLEQINNDPL